jgi:AcrR family transcriptional regulator
VPPADQPTDRVRQTALATTTQLLAEVGLDSFTMDDVVRRSGLSKSTLYRWWPSKGSLAFDAFREKIREVAEAMDEFMPYEDRGRAEGELFTQVNGMMQLLARTDTGRTLADLIAEGRRDDRVLDSFRTDFLMPRRRRSREIIERELIRLGRPDAVPADVVLDLLYGAIYFRLLVGHAPLDEAFARQIVDFVTAGLTGSAMASSASGEVVDDPGSASGSDRPADV